MGELKPMLLVLLRISLIGGATLGLVLAIAFAVSPRLAGPDPIQALYVLPWAGLGGIGIGALIGAGAVLLAGCYAVLSQSLPSLPARAIIIGVGAAMGSVPGSAIVLSSVFGWDPLVVAIPIAVIAGVGLGLRSFFWLRDRRRDLERERRRRRR